MTHIFYRGRRLRSSAALRSMVRETSLRPESLIMPYFVADTADCKFKSPIPSMPGQFQLSLDMLVDEVGPSVDAGLTSCLLFGLPDAKDEKASGAYADDGIIQKAVRRLKKAFPKLVIITDVCLCEYTSHGHCGMVTPEGDVLNDDSLSLIARTALSHAKAGADIVAPSDMMDGRVTAIREALDANGFSQLPVMSYAAKYASAFYGPFRDAAESAPQFGDRKTYQMDPANSREALREVAADMEEGADMIIVKPAGPYLDILRQTRDFCDLPIAAYQVSGEYSMIKAAAMQGWIDENAVVLESLTGIKRAGADMIITYFAAKLLQERLLP